MSRIRSKLSDFRDASRARVSGLGIRRGGPSRERIGAVALALVILVSMLAMPLGASVATAQSGPSGMVALGPDQVDEDLPSDTDVPIRASDLEGNVYASDHAGSLQITVTTPERASDYMGENANVVADDEIAIVLADDEVHEGRDVAVDLDVLEAGVGYVPDVAYGIHDSGEEWQSPIEQTDGVGRFHVDEFSSNSVTFSGGIELSGNSAADGTNYQYELDNLNGIEDYEINLTGVTNKEWRNETKQNVPTGGSETITVGGTTSPEGLSGSNNPTIDVSLPFEHDSAELPGLRDGTEIAIDGNYAFVSGERTDTLHVVDISDPSKMEQTGIYDARNANSLDRPYGIALTNNGDTAVQAGKDESEIQVYDVSDREANPVFESDKSTATYPIGVVSDADTSGIVYVAGSYYGELVAYDVSDPANPTDVGSVDPAEVEDLRGVEYQSGHVFGANPVNDQFVTFDVSDPSNPSLAGSASDPILDGANDVAIAGDHAYVASDAANSLTVVDISDPTAPTVVGSVSDGSALDEAKGVAVSGSEAYVETSGGMAIVDVSSSASPRVVDHYDGQGNQDGLGAVVSDGKAFWASSDMLNALTTYEMASSVAVDADDGTSATIGDLETGETVTQEFPVSQSATAIDVSGTGDAIDWDLRMKELMETRDPVVKVNGYETEYNGVLSEGETTSLATNEAWLQEGTNNVTVRTNTPSNGPESLVDMTYSHDASGVTKSVDVEATSWTESFNVSHTFPSAVSDADATLTFDKQVAEINKVEYRTDGGSWQAPPDYELNGTDLHVGLGDVEADTEIDVRATGHKVRAYDGAVKVTEPTVEGDDLSTEVEITDINPDGMFGLRVDETVLGDRLHYASEESWTGESAYVDLTSSGTQILRAPDANEGSTMRVSTAPVSVSPSSGAIVAEVEDGSEPTFSLRKGNTTGSDRIEVTYYNTVTGDRYVLWSETREVEVDADRAESPVNFVTDGSSETYSILQRDAGGDSPDPPVPTETEDVFPLLLAFGGIGGVLVGSTFVSRRFNIGGWLLPVTATSLTAVAIQVLAPGSPLLRVAQLASESDAVTITAVAAILLGMWQIDERTSGNIPWYYRAPIGVISVIWALETLSPGVILGGLRSGIDSMGPLIVIVIVGGGALLVREYLKARQAPDTVVEFQAGDQ